MNRFRTAMALGAAIVALSCTSPVDPITPTTVLINTGAIALDALGATAQLDAVVRDQDGLPIESPDIIWSSSNGSVATVSETGLVTAVSVGLAEITATSGDVSDQTGVDVTQPVSGIVKASGDQQIGTVGAALATPIEVRLEDRLGSPIEGIQLDFVVTVGGGSLASPTATTNSDGRATSSWTLGTQAGTHQVTTTVSGESSSTAFSATALPDAPDALQKIAGDNQTDVPNATLPQLIVVRVVDQFDNPISGENVTFTVTAGGGTVNSSSVQTDANGDAAVEWTLGSEGNNSLTASANNIADVTFDATATAVTGDFDIDVRFLSTPTASQQAAFDNAAARWESLITGDVVDVPLTTSAGACASGSPALDETVDDVIIFASITPIDGPGGILGSAGPCFIRSGNDLTILGAMEFDSDDVASLENDGLFEDVILHEMGHVLGIGTLWDIKGLLIDPSQSGGTDPHFVGTEALAQFDAIGGDSYTGGNKVPVEDTGGPGTADGHWRESVFDNELMTGFIDVTSNPLSVVTVGSLEDLGYQVDSSGADSFTLNLSLRAGSFATLALGNDIRDGLIYRVDRSGRVLETVSK